MTHLRMFVGMCFLLAVIGSVAFVLLGSGPVFAAAEKADLLNINAATAD